MARLIRTPSGTLLERNDGTKINVINLGLPATTTDLAAALNADQARTGGRSTTGLDIGLDDDNGDVINGRDDFPGDNGDVIADDDPGQNGGGATQLPPGPSNISPIGRVVSLIHPQTGEIKNIRLDVGDPGQRSRDLNKLLASGFTITGTHTVGTGEPGGPGDTGDPGVPPPGSGGFEGIPPAGGNEAQSFLAKILQRALGRAGIGDQLLGQFTNQQQWFQDLFGEQRGVQRAATMKQLGVIDPALTEQLGQFGQGLSDRERAAFLQQRMADLPGRQRQATEALNTQLLRSGAIGGRQPGGLAQIARPSRQIASEFAGLRAQSERDAIMADLQARLQSNQLAGQAFGTAPSVLSATAGALDPSSLLQASLGSAQQRIGAAQLGTGAVQAAAPFAQAFAGLDPSSLSAQLRGSLFGSLLGTAPKLIEALNKLRGNPNNNETFETIPPDISNTPFPNLNNFPVRPWPIDDPLWGVRFPGGQNPNINCGFMPGQRPCF